GTSYYVAVDGFGGDTGNVTLHWGELPVGDPTPCPVQPPIVTGSPHVGTVLTSTTGTWVGAGTASRQWARCQAEFCRTIPGATGDTYTVTARDIGTNIRVDVVKGGALSTSDPTGVVPMTPTSPNANGKLFFSSTRA